jgi:hypothetical protein
VRRKIILFLNFTIMLSLKEFRAKAENLISHDDLGKFVGGYDKMEPTTKEQNPYNNEFNRFTFTDRLWYDASYDFGNFAGWDFRAANWAVELTP